MEETLLLKDIAKEIGINFSAAAFRLHILRKENPKCEYFNAPYDRRTLEAIANYSNRNLPNDTYDPEQAKKERDEKAHYLGVDTLRFMKYFFPEEKTLKYISLQCPDGSTITGRKMLYRWLAIGKPTPEEFEDKTISLFDLLSCSNDTKVFNKKKKEAGLKQRIRAVPSYSLILEKCLRVRPEDSEELVAWKSNNRKEIKEIMKEFGVDVNWAKAEWLLENKYITHETYWYMRDKQEEAKYLEFLKQF